VQNLCFDKATELGIRTGRLPIGRYLANLQTRKVLTVNQVVEIMLKWVETRDWQEALECVVPRRKFKTNNAEDGADNNSVEKDEEPNGESDVQVHDAT
jgi:tRNA (guanine9-N1)-methyltransferase